MALPEITVAIAFTTAPTDTVPEYEDVTRYVRAAEGISITRGRQDEHSEIQPARCNLTLENSDGRFTPERSSSPYYPNVKKSKRIRVSARWPLASVQPGNFVTNSTFEVDAAGWIAWTFGTYGGGSIARSTVRAWEGVASGLITWPTFAAGSLLAPVVSGLVIGKTYTASAYVYVPSGNPDVRMTVGFGATGSYTSVKDAWTRISLTFTAVAVERAIGVEANNTTAGQICYVDALMVDEGSTVATFTTDPPPIYHRFTGYIDEWPVAWGDASATTADISIGASSRQARLALGAELRSIVEVEYLQDNPVLYYPFGDDEGTIRAGNVSTSVQPPMTAVNVGGGGSITFGSATGPATDGLTAAAYTRGSPTVGSYMRAVSPQEVVGFLDPSLLIECFFLATTAQEMGLVSLDGDSLTQVSSLGITAAGKLTAASATFGFLNYTLTSAATVTDGATHHAALRETFDNIGATLRADLFLDGVSVANTTIAWDGFASRYRLVAGGGLVNSCFAGTLCHIAAYGGDEISDARIMEHFLAGNTGFSGERSDERIARLARYAAVPTAELSVETGLSIAVANQDTTGKMPLALMNEVTSTEGGLLFDAGDGTWTFQARSHRYNSMSALTLSAGVDLQPGLQPKLDDLGLANDITASREGGVSIRAVDESSITDYGSYRDSLALITTDDDEVYDAAYWGLNQRSAPLIRVPGCAVELLCASSSQVTAVLARELGDRITLANLPTQAPSSSLDFFIEGISEQITPDGHWVEFSLSPASLSGVWQLDSSVYSVLDTSTRLAY